MLNGPANLRECDKSYSKGSYFICHKTLQNGSQDFANIGICVCVGLSNLSPFGNLSHHVFFLFDLFFRHRRPINVAGVVVGNPRFHHIKTVLC